MLYIDLVGESLPGNNTYYYTSISIIIIVISSLSALGSLLVILAYIVFKHTRNFANKLVVYLCTSDLLTCLSTYYIVPFQFKPQQNIQTQDWFMNVNNGFLCYTQAFTLVFSELSSILWSCIIAYSTYTSVAKNNRNIQESEKIFLFVGFAVPILLTIIPAGFQDFSPQTYYCWFTQHDNNNDPNQVQVWDIITLTFFKYGPLWLSIIYIFVLIILTLRFLKKKQINEDVVSFYKKMILYPLILVVCGLFNTISRVLQLFFPNIILPYWLILIQYIFGRLQGFLNALVYGIYPNLYKNIKQIFTQGKNFRTQINQDSQTTNQLNSFLLDDEELVIEKSYENEESQSQQRNLESELKQQQ